MSRVQHGDYQHRGNSVNSSGRRVLSAVRASIPDDSVVDSTKRKPKHSDPARASLDSFVSLQRNYATKPSTLANAAHGRHEGTKNAWAPTIMTRSGSNRVSDSNERNVSPKLPIRVLKVTGPVENYDTSSSAVVRERVPNRPVRGNAPPFILPPVSNESSRSRVDTPSHANHWGNSSSMNNSNNAIFIGIGPGKNQNGSQRSPEPLINTPIIKYTQPQVSGDVMHVSELPPNRNGDNSIPLEKNPTPRTDVQSNQLERPSNPNISKSSAATTVLHAPQHPYNMKKETQGTIPEKKSISSQSTSLSNASTLPPNAAHISTTTITRTIRKIKYLPVEEEYIESDDDDEGEPLENVVPPSTAETFIRGSGTGWRSSLGQSSDDTENNGNGQVTQCKSGEPAASMYQSTLQSSRTNSGLSTVSLLSSNKWARRNYIMTPVQTAPEVYPARAPIIAPKGKGILNGANFLLQRHHQFVEIGRRTFARHMHNNSSCTGSNDTEPRPFLIAPSINTVGAPINNDNNNNINNGNHHHHHHRYHSDSGSGSENARFDNASGALNRKGSDESGNSKERSVPTQSSGSSGTPRGTVPNSHRLQEISSNRQLSCSMRSNASCATVTQAITVDPTGDADADDVDLAKKPDSKRPRRVIVTDVDWDEEGEYEDEYDDEEEYEEEEGEEYEEDVYTGEVYDMAVPASPTLTVAAPNVVNPDSTAVTNEHVDSDSGSSSTD
ncbi:uncharacterized protein TM35_000351400 [Trypanosoma theileri]|uniref:Uncharacterized protein n=1 Tax=Trypanosoma theileri TaxID=67003 RepID=A0A1X0NL21_9TRYP|nr:uncharacterized protein TM35_000351400 [Trypanosoma theileri]ORC85396.1 hypothetical protein TM35_000351400 [Trypanosoma theileri]